MSRRINIGIRPSLLAFKQAQEIQSRLPGIVLDIIRLETTGDIDQTTPLFDLGQPDFFTDKIEQALLKGSIDAAIHSAKDLAESIPGQLDIVALTRSVSPHDALVSYRQRTLDQLPAGSRVGTSSQARRDGILRYRNDLVVHSLRGNVDDRLGQLDRGRFEAIIVAEAALIRLGQQERITQLIPAEIIEPHPLQGRLAIQIKKDRADLKRIFEVLDET